MSEAIEQYVGEVARWLWVKAGRKRDILEELRSHVEATFPNTNRAAYPRPSGAS
ncbi:MAG: hypothetical protein JXR37_26425 [Kiritimatiellae bacterium]|nr:hypothetical protein [Kiritimatiellia bacterium]